VFHLRMLRTEVFAPSVHLLPYGVLTGGQLLSTVSGVGFWVTTHADGPLA
jgi:hypothetical protein